MQTLKAAKQHAKKLLEAAKRAVEIAIEDSEAAALAYLSEVAPTAH
jgi:type I restriction enzyme S subunit